MLDRFGLALAAFVGEGPGWQVALNRDEMTCLGSVTSMSASYSLSQQRMWWHGMGFAP